MESNHDSSKKWPAGRTAPAGQNPAPTAREEKPLLEGAGGDTWAQSRVLWTCVNALEMRRSELMLELRDLDAAEDRIRGWE
jgi:hypothetical protein